MFLKSSAAGLGGLGLLAAGCAREAGREPAPAQTAGLAETAGHSLPHIGLQLYTIRTILAKDFTGGIEQVAAAGYDEVEFAGYYDQDLGALKAMLDRLGLAAPSTHIPLERLKNDLDGVIGAAKALGHQYVVCPWLAESERKSLADYRGHAAFFNETGRRLKEAGLQFAYHNHDFEFEAIDGQLPYDVLLAETDPALVQMELDLYWITYAGKDPLAYFAQHPGRFPLCHVKDMAADKRMVSVGQGDIDFAAIFARSEQAGFRHYFVEHDNPDDPIRSIQASCSYLKTLRY